MKAMASLDSQNVAGTHYQTGFKSVKIEAT